MTSDYVGKVYLDKEDRVWRVVVHIDSPSIKLKCIDNPGDQPLVNPITFAIGSLLHQDFKELKEEK